MRLVTVSDLATRARRAADMEASAFVTDAEVRGYVNDGLTELWDLLVGAYGEDYFLQQSTFTLSGSAETVALPSDFYKLRGVDLALSGTNYLPVNKYGWRRRNRGTWYPGGAQVGTFVDMEYRLEQGKVRFTPKAGGSYGGRIWYVPTSPVLQLWNAIATTDVSASADTITIAGHGLRGNATVRLSSTTTLPAGLSAGTDYYVIVTDADTVQLATSEDGDAVDITDTGTGTHTLQSTYDGINGWEEYAVVWAAIKCLAKEESDTSAQERQLGRLRMRLEEMAEERDIGEPETVTDIYANEGMGGGWG
jgi:hypothetical protein